MIGERKKFLMLRDGSDRDEVLPFDISGNQLYKYRPEGGNFVVQTVNGNVLLSKLIEETFMEDLLTDKFFMNVPRDEALILATAEAEARGNAAHE